jgi:hypothetical protein
MKAAAAFSTAPAAGQVAAKDKGVEVPMTSAVLQLQTECG